MSNARMALRQHRLKSDPRFSDRPAREQGFGQVVVDMPVDPNVRYIREVSHCHDSYNVMFFGAMCFGAKGTARSAASKLWQTGPLLLLLLL